jgi:hypothetical protein
MIMAKVPVSRKFLEIQFLSIFLLAVARVNSSSARVSGGAVVPSLLD